MAEFDPSLISEPPGTEPFGGAEPQMNGLQRFARTPGGRILLGLLPGFNQGYTQAEQLARLKDLDERQKAVQTFSTLREILQDPDPNRRDVLFDYWGTSTFGKDMKPQIDAYRKLLKQNDENTVSLMERALGNVTSGISSGNISVRDAFNAFRDPIKAYQFVKGLSTQEEQQRLLSMPEGGAPAQAAASPEPQAAPAPPQAAAPADPQALIERGIDHWRAVAQRLAAIGAPKEAVDVAEKNISLLENRLTRMGDTQTETIVGDDGQNYRIMFNKRTGQAMRVLGAAGRDTQVIQGTDEAGNPQSALVNKNTGDIIATLAGGRMPGTLSERIAMAEQAYRANPTAENKAALDRATRAQQIETGFREATGLATARGTAQARLEQPVGEKAPTLINPRTLQSPPTTMTHQQAIAAGYVEVPEKERASLADLEQTKAILSTIETFANRLITAENLLDRSKQAAALTAGAMSGTNAPAATYQAQRQAFLGIISRTLGGERGVLTDRDIGRIDSALPSFSDSKTTKDLKIGLLKNLLTTATEAKLALMTGQPMQTGAVERIQRLLDAAEKANAKNGGDKDIDAARKRLGLD